MREFRDRWPDATPPPVQQTDLDYLLVEDFSDLHSVIVIGGEPFLNIKYAAVLERMVQQGHAGHIKITSFTNGTHAIPARLLALAPNFENFNILVSVDGVGPAFDYIRTGGRWPEVDRNIGHFFDLGDHNILVMFTTVISALNVLTLPRIYDYFLSQFRIPDIGGTAEWLEGRALYQEVLERGWMVNTVLQQPSHYTFEIFTESQKQQIRQTLVHPYYDFAPVLAALEQSQHRPELLEKFWEEVAWTRHYHGLDIRDHLPELVALLES